jgi:hypothetical protein
MHEITQKVKQQEGCNKAGPSLGDGPGGQSDAQLSLELRPEGVRRRKDKGSKDQIEDPDPEIAEPPPQRRELAPPPRPAEFPGRDDDQAAYQYDDGQLISPAGAGDPPSRVTPHTDIYSNRPRTGSSHCHGH